MEPNTQSAIHDALIEAGPSLAQLSHALWSNPEIGLEEEKAHDVITAFLEQRGFQVERHAVLPTGFVASHTASSTSAGPHVALMAEFDALPDVGHACGHNLIAAVSVGAGLAVRAAMAAAGLAGRVSVFGTPAEESVGGKINFLRAGRFRDVDAALMVHPCGGTSNVLLPATTATENVIVTFTGKATHAAANPWQGVNALDAAVLAYQNVAVKRQQFRPQWRAMGIITDGGKAVNVIPDRTQMYFTVRAPNIAELRQVSESFHACMEAAAIATGCSVTVEERNPMNTEVRHNLALAKVFEKHAEACGIVMERESFFGGATDMGNVSYEVPSIHPLFHIGSSAQIHERDFAKDTGSEAAHKFVIEQATILAMTAVEVLTSSELREKMRKEFAEIKE